MIPAWFGEVRDRVLRIWPTSAPKSEDAWLEWYSELSRFEGEAVLGALQRLLEAGKERLSLPALIGAISEIGSPTPAPRPDPELCYHPRLAFPSGPTELPPLRDRVAGVYGSIEMQCALCLATVTKNVKDIRTQGEVDGWVM